MALSGSATSSSLPRSDRGWHKQGTKSLRSRLGSSFSVFFIQATAITVKVVQKKNAGRSGRGRGAAGSPPLLYHPRTGRTAKSSKEDLRHSVAMVEDPKRLPDDRGSSSSFPRSRTKTDAAGRGGFAELSASAKTQNTEEADDGDGRCLPAYKHHMLSHMYWDSEGTNDRDWQDTSGWEDCREKCKDSALFADAANDQTKRCGAWHASVPEDWKATDEAQDRPYVYCRHYNFAYIKEARADNPTAFGDLLPTRIDPAGEPWEGDDAPFADHNPIVHWNGEDVGDTWYSGYCMRSPSGQWTVPATGAEKESEIVPAEASLATGEVPPADSLPCDNWFASLSDVAEEYRIPKAQCKYFDRLAICSGLTWDKDQTFPGAQQLITNSMDKPCSEQCKCSDSPLNVVEIISVLNLPTVDEDEKRQCLEPIKGARPARVGAAMLNLKGEAVKSPPAATLSGADTAHADTEEKCKSACFDKAECVAWHFQMDHSDSSAEPAGASCALWTDGEVVTGTDVPQTSEECTKQCADSDTCRTASFVGEHCLFKYAGKEYLCAQDTNYDAATCPSLLLDTTQEGDAGSAVGFCVPDFREKGTLSLVSDSGTSGRSWTYGEEAGVPSWYVDGAAPCLTKCITPEDEPNYTCKDARQGRCDADEDSTAALSLPCDSRRTRDSFERMYDSFGLFAYNLPPGGDTLYAFAEMSHHTCAAFDHQRNCVTAFAPQDDDGGIADLVVNKRPKTHPRDMYEAAQISFNLGLNECALQCGCVTWLSCPSTGTDSSGAAVAFELVKGKKVHSSGAYSTTDLGDSADLGACADQCAQDEECAAFSGHRSAVVASGQGEAAAATATVQCRLHSQATVDDADLVTDMPAGMDNVFCRRGVPQLPERPTATCPGQEIQVGTSTATFEASTEAKTISAKMASSPTDQQTVSQCANLCAQSQEQCVAFSYATSEQECNLHSQKNLDDAAGAEADPTKILCEMTIEGDDGSGNDGEAEKPPSVLPVSNVTPITDLDLPEAKSC